MRWIPTIPWLEGEVYRRAFRARRGWYAPMAVLCSLLLVLLLSLEPGGRRVAEVAGEWVLFLGIVGMVATMGASLRSFRALGRMGSRGMTRPRWWFELGSLGCNFFVAAALGMAGIGVLAWLGLPKVWEQGLWRLGRWLLGASFVTFMVATVIGFSLAVLRRRRCSGTAYDCVQFFFTAIGGVTLVTIGGCCWPPAQIWPDAVLVAVCGGGGLVILVWGMWVLLLRAAAKNE